MTDAGLAAARRRRDEILASAELMDSVAIHVQLGGDRTAPGAQNTASRLRRAGQLLGVWTEGAYLHPAFQIDPTTGLVREEMAPLLKLLPEDQSGWRQAFWLYQPHGRLGGRPPSEVFATDPAAVLAAARATYEPGDTDW